MFFTGTMLSVTNEALMHLRQSTFGLCGEFKPTFQSRFQRLVKCCHLDRVILETLVIITDPIDFVQ